jgi:hypothetical protein
VWKSAEPVVAWSAPDVPVGQLPADRTRVERTKAGWMLAGW